MSAGAAGTDGRRAVIVGAGLGGLAAALALKQAGFDAVVHDRGSELRAIQLGGGISFWSNGMRALQEIGLMERALELGDATAPLRRTEIRDWRGKLLSEWSVDLLAREAGAPSIGLRRPDLHAVLAAALGEDAIRFKTVFAGFEQDDQGVTVRFDDGSTERADVLVGADGLRSAVRAQFWGAVEPRYTGFTSRRAVVELDHERAPDDTLEVWLGRGSAFVIFPIGKRRFYWEATRLSPPGHRDPPDGCKEAVASFYAAWAKEVPEMIATTQESAIIQSDVLDRPPLKRWGNGRVTLLGDAAHPVTPSFGQGANQAVEDGVVLGKCLSEHRDVPAALQAYEARRIARTTPIVRRSEFTMRVRRFKNPLACLVRDTIIKTGSRMLVRDQRELLVSEF